MTTVIIQVQNNKITNLKINCCQLHGNNSDTVLAIKLFLIYVAQINSFYYFEQFSEFNKCDGIRSKIF